MNPTRLRAVAAGASAGALEALSVWLPLLPADFPAPVFLVVHRPRDRESLLVELLRGDCRLPIREAEDKEPIEPGTIYVAPPDYHMLIEPDHRLSLSAEEPVWFSRPSIDVLFETAAEAYGDGLAGVVLTGANGDGARGLRAIRDAGGIALAQRPDTAAVAAMPLAAMAACPDALALTLEEIAEYLRGMVVTR